MFNSQVFDVALGLIFIYFFLAIVLSVANEWIAQKQNWRPQMLYNGILYLLGDDKDLVEKLYTNPLFLGDSPDVAKEKAKEKKESYSPSYISSRSFALALMESLKNGDKPSLVEDVKGVVKQMDPENRLRKALLPLFDIAQADLDKTLKNIESWYEDSQDRIIGFYKRRSNKYIFVLALVLCVILNADTFRIAQSLYTDQTLRAAVVSAAEQQISKPMPTDPAKREAWEKSIVQTSKQLNLPLGWCVELPWLRNSLPALCGKTPPPAPVAPESETETGGIILWFLLKIIGILFTAGAVSMGAPFWFDLMNKVINLRNTGKRPEEGKKAGAAPAG